MGERVRFVDADLVIVDEFSMVDMWLADKFFSRIKDGARVVLVGDPDQLPSVGAGNVFRELIDCGLIPVTVLDQIFRQSKDSLIAYNAKFITRATPSCTLGRTLYLWQSDNQAELRSGSSPVTAGKIAESGIDRVQILSPFVRKALRRRNNSNEAIREVVNPFALPRKKSRSGV